MLHDLNLYVEPKKAESRQVVNQGWGGGGNGEMFVRGYKVAVNRKNKSRDLMLNIITTVNNTVLNIGHSLRE